MPIVARFIEAVKQKDMEIKLSRESSEVNISHIKHLLPLKYLHIS